MLSCSHQLHAVVFDGLGAHLEGESDALGGLALGNELEDLALTLSQLPDRAAGTGDLVQRSTCEGGLRFPG